MQKASSQQVGGSHYKNLKHQPAEFCQKYRVPFCQSCAIKYAARHRNKNGRQDIEKAIHFLELAKEWHCKRTWRDKLAATLLGVGRIPPYEARMAFANQFEAKEAAFIKAVLRNDLDAGIKVAQEILTRWYS